MVRSQIIPPAARDERPRKDSEPQTFDRLLSFYLFREFSCPERLKIGVCYGEVTWGLRLVYHFCGHRSRD
jgi:hypothetical protein